MAEEEKRLDKADEAKAAEKGEKKEEAKPEKIEEPKEKPVIAIRDISIALDTYSDIFSDFDPRPFSTRELSEDLIKELELRVRTNVKGNFEIRFFLPRTIRDEKIEAQVLKRLKAYFRMRSKEVEGEDMERKKTSAMYVVTGLAALFTFAFLLEFSPYGSLGTFLEILLVPVGWFFMWEGLAKLLLQERSTMEKQVKFYQNLSKANFIFLSEEGNIAGAQAEQG